jgi:hypothetical protein
MHIFTRWIEAKGRVPHDSLAERFLAADVLARSQQGASGLVHGQSVSSWGHIICHEEGKLMRFLLLKGRAASRIATLALALALGGVLALGAEVPANAAPPNVTICIAHTSYCADVKDSQDVAGQPVWLYATSEANDYHWLKITESCTFGTCYEFQDAQNTSLCLAVENPPYGNADVNIEIQPCSQHVYWYIQAGGYMPNNQNFGQDLFYSVAPNPVQDKDVLELVGGTCCYDVTYTWTVS